MFNFIFGGKRKIELIRDLLEQRMNDAGYIEMEFRLKIKQMGNIELMSMPEATLVSIIESVQKLQRKGYLIKTILAKNEDQRRRLGHDEGMFQDVIEVARSDNAGMAVPMYCKYRIDIEHRGVMNDQQFVNAFEKATSVLLGDI